MQRHDRLNFTLYNIVTVPWAYMRRRKLFQVANYSMDLFIPK